MLIDDKFLIPVILMGCIRLCTENELNYNKIHLTQLYSNTDHRSFMQCYTWPRSRKAVHTRSLVTQVVLHRTAKSVDFVWQHENTFDVLPFLLHSSSFPHILMANSPSSNMIGSFTFSNNQSPSPLQ